MSVYRDDASGLAARLADLRAAWAANAAEVPAAAQEAFVARSRRLWAARVGVAMVLLMIGSIVVSLVTRPAPYVPVGAAHAHDLGEDSPLMLIGSAFFSLMLMAAVVVAKFLGYVYGEHAAKLRLRTLLAGDTGAMDPVRALAYLTEETPRRLLAAEAQRLERASVLAHLASAPWPTFMLACSFLIRFFGDPPGVWLDGIPFMGILWLVQGGACALTLSTLRGSGGWPTWARDLCVTLSIVALIAAFIGMPATGYFLLVHVITLGFRAVWVRGDVLRERAALC